jgi:hypothetical protein
MTDPFSGPEISIALRALHAEGVAYWSSFSTAAFLARLSKGASAGRFAPSPRAPAPDSESERAKIMAWHAAAVEELASLVASWPEKALDRRNLPHPLLGKLTVREMLLFTLYHNRHHVDVVRRRAAPASAV